VRYVRFTLDFCHPVPAALAHKHTHTHSPETTPPYVCLSVYLSAFP